MSTNTTSPFGDTTMSSRFDTTTTPLVGRTGDRMFPPARGALVWSLVTAPATSLGARWRVACRALVVVPEGAVGTHRHDLRPERGGVAADRQMLSLLVDIATRPTRPASRRLKRQDVALTWRHCCATRAERSRFVR